jgi:hypothetical protein
MKTAIDIVLTGVSNGSITQEDAKILLEAINQRGNTTFVPLPYKQPPSPTTPWEQNDVWYTTGTTNNSQIK